MFRNKLLKFERYKQFDNARFVLARMYVVGPFWLFCDFAKFVLKCFGAAMRILE